MKTDTVPPNIPETNKTPHSSRSSKHRLNLNVGGRVPGCGLGLGLGSQSREVRLINSVAILVRTSSVIKGSPCFLLRLKGSPCDPLAPSRRLASRMMPQKRTRLSDHTVTCQCERCANLNNLPPMEDDPAHMGMEEVVEEKRHPRTPLNMPHEIAVKATPPHEIPSPHRSRRHPPR